MECAEKLSFFYFFEDEKLLDVYGLLLSLFLCYQNALFMLHMCKSRFTLELAFVLTHLMFCG